MTHNAFGVACTAMVLCLALDAAAEVAVVKSIVVAVRGAQAPNAAKILGAFEAARVVPQTLGRLRSLHGVPLGTNPTERLDWMAQIDEAARRAAQFLPVCERFTYYISWLQWVTSLEGSEVEESSLDALKLLVEKLAAADGPSSARDCVHKFLSGLYLDAKEGQLKHSLLEKVDSSNSISVMVPIRARSTVGDLQNAVVRMTSDDPADLFVESAHFIGAPPHPCEADPDLAKAHECLCIALSPEKLARAFASEQ